MQGDFRKMQGGGHRNLAKSHQISIAWMASSLVKRTGKEQGRPSLPSRVVMNLLANYGQHRMRASRCARTSSLVASLFFSLGLAERECTLKRVGPPQFGGLVVFVILSRGLEFATIPVAKTFSWCSLSGSSCMTSI